MPLVIVASASARRLGALLALALLAACGRDGPLTYGQVRDFVKQTPYGL